jgi:hypothetical protein
VQNLRNEEKNWKKIAKEVFLKPGHITREQITEFGNGMRESFEKREEEGRLTGQWIVFAKHEGRNYYLAVASHKENYQELYDRIVESCKEEFPFLFGSREDLS